VEYPLVLAQVAGSALVHAPPLVSASVDVSSVRERGCRGFLPVLRGCLLALPVLVVFAVFLAAADLVFARYLGDLFSVEFFADLLESLWRGVIVLAVAWGVAGGLSYALSRCSTPDDERGVASHYDSLMPSISVGFVEVTTLLISVDLLFLVFVWIQFTYLFGGQANINVEGYTYAEYARRGFFELLAVAVLSLGLILGLRQFTRREKVWQSELFNGLSSVMVGCVLIMLASAYERLLLYEDAFGYTQLRLYSHVLMVWLAFTFVWFLVVQWLRPDRFAFGAFLAALGFLITLNVINPDASIAARNLSRYQASGKLDVDYLATLSEDAVPILVRSQDRLADDERRALDEHQDDRLERMQNDKDWRRWPSFHLARFRAYDLLSASQAD
jgi:hypothetical protein